MRIYVQCVGNYAICEQLVSPGRKVCRTGLACRCLDCGGDAPRQPKLAFPSGAEPWLVAWRTPRKGITVFQAKVSTNHRSDVQRGMCHSLRLGGVDAGSALLQWMSPGKQAEPKSWGGLWIEET